ncbi:MAG: hypothetical protein U0794_02080 [Isosphaeraceae bacterium]
MYRRVTQTVVRPGMTALVAVRCLMAFALVGVATPRASAAFEYTITSLGTLGGNQSFALDINNRGQATGNASRVSGSNLPLNAALWSLAAPASPTNLGRLPGADSDFSRGYAINDSGKVVGESSNNTSRAFLWSNGVMTDLGTLGGASAVAHDINNLDKVVGIASTGSQSHAFIWQNGVMTDLGTLGGTLSRAWGINDAGQIVGISRIAGDATSHAFLSVGGAMIDLGSLGGPSRFSEALAINSLGLVVGRSTINDSGDQRATLWNGGTISEIGTLTNPSTGSAYRFSRANDINKLGLAVGTASTFEGFSGRAFVWDSARGIRDLNDLIAPGSGWVLTSAEGVNEQGQIVGYGTFGGQTRAFVLTAVPEPAGLVQLVIGSLTALAWASRAPRNQRK